eukprot:6171855-Pleurochrysis_carterae.AAC.2
MPHKMNQECIAQPTQRSFEEKHSAHLKKRFHVLTRGHLLGIGRSRKVWIALHSVHMNIYKALAFSVRYPIPRVESDEQ